MLPSGQEIEAPKQISEDLAVVQMRIKDNLNTLRNFAVGCAYAGRERMGSPVAFDIMV